MLIQNLIDTLKEYPPTTDVKILVNENNDDVRCLIFDEKSGTLYLSDSAYGC